MKNTRSLAGWGSAALAVALLTGCASNAGKQSEPVSYHAAYPAFATGAELIKSADLVIRGVALKSRVERLYPETSTGTDPQTNPQAGLAPDQVDQAKEDSGVVVTVSTVRVDEAIKGGAAAGDTVEISQLGGTLDGVQYQDTDTSILSSDGTGYVLFLAAHGAGKPYDLLNPEQALYTAGTDGSLKAAGDAKSLGFADLRTLKSAVSATK